MIPDNFRQDLGEVPEMKLLNCNVLPVWDPADDLTLEEVLLDQLIQLFTTQKDGERGLSQVQAARVWAGPLEVQQPQ